MDCWWEEAECQLRKQYINRLEHPPTSAPLLLSPTKGGTVAVGQGLLGQRSSKQRNPDPWRLTYFLFPQTEEALDKKFFLFLLFSQNTCLTLSILARSLPSVTRYCGSQPHPLLQSSSDHHSSHPSHFPPRWLQPPPDPSHDSCSYPVCVARGIFPKQYIIDPRQLT